MWSTGSTAAQITVADSGLYTVSANNGGCIVRDTFQLTVLATPELEFQQGLFVCADNEAEVLLDAGPGQTYLWSPGGDTTQVVAITEPGNWSVVVTHANGCTRTAIAEVGENCPELLFIPGAFTPNNDGKNDVFYAEGTNVKNFKIRIFNRWGQQLFETSNIGITGGWNGKFEGKNASEGVYTYQLSYDALQLNGRTKPEKRSGYFVLLR
ncbi:MAG: gliding motility-associated C-terminal domain-containing protein [Bacteroidetes bacterium]|nr:gliding motility-associated C-terminal domain-containing protein [Bacteroidota bacterium]